MPQRPVVVLSYFTLRDLGNLLDAVRRSGIAEQADVHIGSYGPNPKTANAAHEEGTLYAPMLGLRTVLPKPLPLTAARRAGFHGVIPPTGDEKSPAIAHIESTGRKARRPEFGHAVWPQRKSRALRLLPRSR
ncbi:MAG: hypothetical protein ACXVRS_17695 [Gaiellaceae bacterium]